jgi:hypothetical protein
VIVRSADWPAADEQAATKDESSRRQQMSILNEYSLLEDCIHMSAACVSYGRQD